MSISTPGLFTGPGIREDLYDVHVILVGSDGQKCGFTFDEMNGGAFRDFDHGGGFGTVVTDGKTLTPNCFYRANPTNDVHEWGAYCVSDS